MPKFGAMSTPTDGFSSHQAATVASLAASNPVVPTMQ